MRPDRDISRVFFSLWESLCLLRYLLFPALVDPWLITRDGRTIGHFDEPADRVVVSDSGGKFITMARRGSVWCLSRVDVQSRKIAAWCHAEISRFTTTFDGATWYIASGQDLYAIDATSQRLDAV